MTHSERDANYKKTFTEALSLLKSGDKAAAAKSFVQAACIHPEKWCNNALELSKRGNTELALACLHEVLSLEAPSIVHAGAWCNIGNIYASHGQNSEAQECFVKSWDIHRSPDAAANRALIHLWRNELTDADRWITQALAINPWQAEAQFTQATISLMRGHYRNGFQQYECRWRHGKNGLNKIPSHKPEWYGLHGPVGKSEPPKPGTRILIYGEQGSGDSILMLRYARLLKEAGFWQCWVLQKGLKPLAESMGVIDQIIYPGDTLPEFDCHLPAASLPRAFGTALETIPPAPYIPVPTRIMPPSDSFNVGIAWRGSIVQGNDKFRSVSLKEFEPVFKVPGVMFHSLQFENATESLLYPDLQIYGPPEDWLVTARRVASLDLVISVDTSIVHLCGAMGVPCWVALHCRPYFVYPLCREDSPWYPSVKLFKQKRELEWAPVFERIADELTKRIVLH